MEHSGKYSNVPAGWTGEGGWTENDPKRADTQRSRTDKKEYMIEQHLTEDTEHDNNPEPDFPGDKHDDSN